MAYMTAIAGTCTTCQLKQATHTVYNNQNARMGDYCERCAAKRVKVLTEQEALQARGT